MAGAEVIGAAIGVLLLIIVGYVLVGTTLASSEVVVSAQKDMTLMQEERLGTSVSIADAHYHTSATPRRIDFRIQNTGDKIIRDPAYMDVMLTWGFNAPILYKYGSGDLGTTTWYYDGWFDKDIVMGDEVVNPGQWDPEEYMWVQIELNSKPTQVGVNLANGVRTTTNSITDVP